MSERKVDLTELRLGDIILCEPLTNRGIEALDNLGLKDKVSPDDFFNDMYINPKYADDALFTQPVDDPPLENIYSVSSDRFGEMKRKLEDFDQKFTSDTVNHSPLLIIGTAGNGKSIEAHNKIRSPKRGNVNIKSNRILYNFEKAFAELPHGVKFSLKIEPGNDQTQDALWLICISLLDELYNLVINHWKNISVITKNYQKYFVKTNNTDDTEKMFFSYIKKYRPRNLKSGKNLFQAMIDLIDENNVIQSIDNLLKKTMNVMYCICPQNKNYIVFDNLEHYIKLNQRYVPIHNSALSHIYNFATKVMGDLTKIYDGIHPRESWRAFKIILVLRRTSAHLLVESDAQYATKFLSMGNDYTGHFDIWRIWDKKMPIIWGCIKDNYNPEQSSAVMEIINDMMKDHPGCGILGMSYQDRIAPLMNSGIRRNGRAQAHAAMCVYDILFKNIKYYIDFATIKKILNFELKQDEKLPGTAKSARYLYRMALLEIQYKWMIIQDDSQERFTKLYLGKLSEIKESQDTDQFGTKINMREVVWDGTEKYNATLVRRILSFLSNFMDKNVVEFEKGEAFKTGLFETKSLYDLMEGIFLNPVEKCGEKKLTQSDHFLPLATVLNSLGSMSHSATKAAPFVILGVNDLRFSSPDPDSAFAVILDEIWQAGPKESSVEGRYKCKDFGVRLTEAGDAFLRNIQPSFSFFAALYCSEEVPLFFLKDPKRIQFVITSVYNAAESLCNDYELAANSFCGINSTLNKPNCNYLPKTKGERITFRHRVKDLHSHHLNLYKDFIENNIGVLDITEDKESFKDMMKQIEKTITSYNNWKLVDDKGKNIECF